jgi:hypothetical protein
MAVPRCRQFVKCTVDSLGYLNGSFKVLERLQLFGHIIILSQRCSQVPQLQRFGTSLYTCRTQQAALQGCSQVMQLQTLSTSLHICNACLGACHDTFTTRTGISTLCNTKSSYVCFMQPADVIEFHRSACADCMYDAAEGVWSMWCHSTLLWHQACICAVLCKVHICILLNIAHCMVNIPSSSASVRS